MNKNSNICELLCDGTSMALIGYSAYTANQAQISSNNAQTNLGLSLDGNNIVPNNKKNLSRVTGSGRGTSTNSFTEVYTKRLGTPGNSSLDLIGGENGQVLSTDGAGKLIWKHVSGTVTLKNIPNNYLSISNQQIESGTVPISLGGTGATNATNALVNLGLISQPEENKGNTKLGSSALIANTTGAQNTAVGSGALMQNNTATANTAVGNQAGLEITTGSNNVCIGTVAGGNLRTGCENVFIGMNAMVKLGSGFGSDSNQICIGYNVNSKGGNKAVIGNHSLTDLYVGSGTNQNTNVSYEGAANIHCNSVILTQEFSPQNTAPSSTSSGLKGEIRWSSDYLFVCVDKNSWKRVTLEEF